MRIISGLKKGKKILLPDPTTTRPLKDSVKENIFNILLHNHKLKIDFNGIKVLDFFSGSGSFGLECLSRSAKYVYFVEKNPKVQNILYRNTSNNFSKEKFNIIKDCFFKIDKEHLIEKIKPNLIFIDPPYEIDNFENIFNYVQSLNKLKKITIILHIKKSNNVFFKSFKLNIEKIYGNSKIIFLKN